jgi:hypothetical protein
MLRALAFYENGTDETERKERTVGNKSDGGGFLVSPSTRGPVDAADID